MRFDQIDLPSLPAPDVIETIDYEVLLREYLRQVVSRGNEINIDLSNAVSLETSPTNIISQVLAYAEMIVRQRANSAARAVMLSSALGSDLDHLGALFGTARMPLASVTAPRPFSSNPEDWEDDERYRRRIQLALEAFSTAGPYGAYVYQCMKVTTRIKDVAVYGPESGLCTPGQALNIILSEEGDGSPTEDILDAVETQLQKSDVRPLTDQVIIRGADIHHYSVEATIYVARGPDPSVIRQAAFDAIDAYSKSRHAIGRIVAESGLKAAAFRGGVERVVLNITDDIDPGPDGAAYCNGIEVTVEVVDGAA